VVRSALICVLLLGCATASQMPLLSEVPENCERLGVVWQGPPFPLWNDWQRGLEAKAVVLGADTLVLRHRYFAFAMATAYRCEFVR